MAAVKWVKITTDMFDNRKIKHLRKLPDGNNIVLIWVMLLTMAGRCNAGGMIFLTENIPYTPKMLADELGFEENTVKLAITALEQLNMVCTDNGFFSIAGWNEYQNVEGMEKIREQTRQRVANHRKKQRALMETSVCQYCGGNATGYDHVLALSRGGTDTDENKVPCCQECNRIKNDKPLVDFLNANRERIRDDLVAGNAKLRKFVTLSNVTGRYNVTQCNATEEDIDIDKEKEKEYRDMGASAPNPSPSHKPKKPVKHKYGEYANVLLTDDELEKLKEAFSDWEERIERLSGYIASTGKAYKSHYATIRNWARKDAQAQPVTRRAEGASYSRKPTKAEELNDFYDMAANWAAEGGENG